MLIADSCLIAAVLKWYVPKARDLLAALQRTEQQLQVFQKISRLMVRELSLPEMLDNLNAYIDAPVPFVPLGHRPFTAELNDKFPTISPAQAADLVIKAMVERPHEINTLLGNVGAVAAGFLFKTSSVTWPQALMVLGGLVLASSTLAFAVRFSERDEETARAEMAARLGAMTPVPAGAGD